MEILFLIFSQIIPYILTNFRVSKWGLTHAEIITPGFDTGSVCKYVDFQVFI